MPTEKGNRMFFYNENPIFGEGGPFEAKSKNEVADEIIPQIRDWAEAEWFSDDNDVPKNEFVNQRADEMRSEFMESLTEFSTIERTDDTPSCAKFVVWQFGEQNYAKTFKKAQEIANEFWARDNSEILQIIN